LELENFCRSVIFPSAGEATLSKAEDYRAKVDHCDKCAEEAKDPEVRRQFKELAR